MFFTLLFTLHLSLFITSFMITSTVMEMEMFNFLSIPFTFSISLDWISMNFSSFVVLISSIIILYSGYYMNMDIFMTKFLFLLILFVLSMIFLIFGGNFFMIMIGWDGLGLVSFLLVVYYSSKESMTSGILTIMMNRLGDGLILLSIFYFSMMSGFNIDLMSSSWIGSFLLMISFLTKSAQFPFSAWLPAAMSAPTPISALVHSSTLVTAGIYLSIRFNFMFLNTSIYIVLMNLSLVTLILGGILANMEMDFKKIVAMSTLSQLGLLFFLISIGFIKLAFFHMISHAFFKSLLFMGTGTIILSGSQDSRSKSLSNTWSFILYSSMTVSLFSLMATPFSIGFYSKDLALDFMFNSNLNVSFYFLFLLGSLMTVKYSFQMMKYLSSNMMLESVSLTNMFSFYFFNSMIMSMLINLTWGKFIFNNILMEDFILMSFPLKTLGMMLILLSFMFKLSKELLIFQMFMMWFKYVVKFLYFSDFLVKSDLMMTEKVYSMVTFNTLKMITKLESFEKSMVWMMFMMLWLILFIAIPL